MSALSVMIESPEEPFGVLAALSTRRRTFAEADVSFVRSVANVLAGAVERSRVQERLGEVREIERSRIARDLHDEALQKLTDALVQADRGPSAGLGTEAVEQLVSTLKRAGEAGVSRTRTRTAPARPTPGARSTPAPDASLHSEAGALFFYPSGLERGADQDVDVSHGREVAISGRLRRRRQRQDRSGVERGG